MRQPYIESATALSYYDEQIIRKCPFYQSLFSNFSRADDHWEDILVLKSAAPCSCILSRVFRQPVSGNEKAMQVLY